MIKTCCLLLCVSFLFATTVRAQAPDLTTPDVQKLKADAMVQHEEIVKQRVEALRKVIDDQLESARQGLTKAKTSGNITATASGTAAVKLFTDVKAGFEKNSAYAVTGKVRTDLESTVDEFKRNIQAVEDKQSADFRKLNRAFAAKLGDVLTRQSTPVRDEAKLLELWTPLLTGAAAAHVAATATTTAPATATTPATGTNAVSAPPAAAAVLEAKGDTSTWTPLMKLDVTVRDALEVVSVSITGITAPKTLTGMGAMGNQWQVQVTPYQELVPGNTTPAFRIQSVPPARTLEVGAWPDARNYWTIDLRAKANRVPSKHAVILETDAAACKPLAGGAAAPNAATAAAATAAMAATAPATPVQHPHPHRTYKGPLREPTGRRLCPDQQSAAAGTEPTAADTV